jgi:hypothetical protein
MKRVYITIVIVASMSAPAAAWWSDGHSHITGIAITHLPQPLRGFFAANLNNVRTQSGQEPAGTHFINVDYYPEFSSGTFPRNKSELVARYGESNVQRQGTAPWTYADYVESLSNRMVSANTKTDWQNLISIAAAQAHYIEDLHNPLHLTQNHNGQLTGNDGIHGRYEGEMVRRHLDELTVSASNATFLPSVIDSVFDAIDVHYYLVDDILSADDAAYAAAGRYNEAYYASLWTQTADFTLDLFQKASKAVADGWYTAWVSAGRPTPIFGLIGDYDVDHVVNASDYVVWRKNMDTQNAYSAWRASFGRTAGSGALSQATAPEPSTITMLLAGLLSAVLRRR